MEHSKATYALLQYVSDNHNCSLLDLMNQTPLSESHIEKQALINRLIDMGLVSISGHNSGNLSAMHLRLTGAGIDLLFRAKEVTPLQEIAETLKMQVAELQNQTRKLQKQVDAEQEAAKAANDLAKTAQAEAVSARKNALFSKVVSIVSLSIGFAALVVSVLSLLV